MKVGYLLKIIYNKNVSIKFYILIFYLIFINLSAEMVDRGNLRFPEITHGCSSHSLGKDFFFV